MVPGTIYALTALPGPWGASWRADVMVTWFTGATDDPGGDAVGHADRPDLARWPAMGA